MKAALALSLLFSAILIVGCEREERKYRQSTPLTSASQDITMSGLHPAQPTQGTQHPLHELATGGIYADNAYAVAEGQKLYNQYNCVGCHANGGGGIGPP